MGRHEPLTALALGRSPYDEVVWPDGEPPASASDDEAGPSQQYDHKGRPINPSTKKMNREIVRAHNEVMQVIGVAEPDNVSNDAEVQSARRYLMYEHNVGDRMERLGKGLMEVGIWAFTGVRHRLLIYKTFSQVPYYKIPAFCKQTIPRPFTSLFLAGLPTELASRGLQWFYERVVNVVLYDVSLPWQLLDYMEEYLTYHVQLWIFLQRVGIISPWRIPSPLFFIPFTSASLIPAPEPPVDFSVGSILQWLGAAAINAAPLICYGLWKRSWVELRKKLMLEIYFLFPLPVGTPEYRVRPGPPPPIPLDQQRPLVSVTAQQPYVPLAEDGSGPDSSSGRAREVAEATITLGEGTPSSSAPLPPTSLGPGSGASPATIRRRSSTFSGRGDDDGSDEEDNEAISGTLISFDVEATDATDAPPGLWSAELRPTLGSDTRSQTSQSVVYLNNALTRQPIEHASRVLGALATTLVTVPIEAIALRLVTHSFLSQRGLLTSHILQPDPFATATLRFVTNYLFVDFLHLWVQADLWITVVQLGRFLHLSPEEWTSIPPDQQSEWV